MSTKDEGTPTAEESKEKNLDTKNDSPKEGADAGEDTKKDQAFRDQQKRAEKAEAAEKAAQAKVAELEQQLADKADSKGEISDEDFEKIAEEEGVSVDFVKKFAGTLEAKISKTAEKLVSSKLSEKDKEEAKKAILNDFKRDFDKVDSEWEGGDLSESAVRMHYLTEKAKNPDHTVEDSIEEIYGSFKTGKATVEDDPQGADRGGEKIDFATLSKDPAKLEKVLKDPKARSKYYDWRDTQGV